MNTSAVAFSEGVARRVGLTIAASGLTQARIAEESGIARVTLIRRLRGTSPFNTSELHALARVLRVSVAVFTDDEDAA